MARILSSLVIVIAAAAVSACSFTPVYGTRQEDMSLAFDFAAPKNRIDQVIYEELVFRLQSTKAPNSPSLTITSSVSTAAPMMTSARPGAQNIVRYETKVTATATVRYGGDELFTVTRFATAQHTGESQVLADDAARIEAEERAAKSVAESLRLAILAQYPKYVRQF
jgi:hypothetical protein